MSTQVTMKTSMGEITIELNEDKAPITVKNFLQYVDSEFYNGTVFHRVINGFMIQGGGMDVNMKEKDTQAPIENEASNGLKNDVYTIAMARTNDVHSATSQFFINIANNEFLNFTSETPQGYGYCVFGKVIEGQDVIDKIGKLKTRVKNGMGDVPIKTVKINSIKVK